LRELKTEFSIIISKYEDFLNDKISLDEFYNKNVLPFLINTRKYKSSLGDINIDSLNLLLSNIKDKFDSYTYQKDLGNEQQERTERREIIMLFGKIVNKLQDLLDNLSERNLHTANNIDNSRIISGDIHEELNLTSDKWDDLRESIRQKKCIPFIGTEIFSSWFPYEHGLSEQWIRNLSEQWTKDYKYPFEDSSQISRVAQFIAIDKGDSMHPKKMLSKMLKEIKPPDFSRDEFKDTPYAVLADLDLPIYITTNYDHFLEEALKSRDKNKNPISEVCRWNDNLKHYLENAGIISMFSKGRKYKPSANNPLVYHIHGDMDIVQSMVLTEKDYIDFIINLSREDEKSILPSSIRTALASSSLLFVGYSLEEINFRILFQGVIGLQVGDLRETSIAVQLVPRLSEDKQKKALKYLGEYTKGMNVHVYWGNSYKFCEDLRQKYLYQSVDIGR
jgi:hypothetical protein